MTNDAVAVLDAEATSNLLPMPELVAAVGTAFDRLAGAPTRLVIPADGQNWVVMPMLLADGGLLCKLLRVADGTGALSGPTIAGFVVVIAPDGSLRALVDGGVMTARRTAAISAHATSLLARPEADVLAVFGAGALAETHVEAIATVRELREIRVVGRSPDRVAALCSRLADRGFDVVATDDPRRALDSASIVVTATTSAEPVFPAAAIEPGTHVNAVGSYQPERAEVPAETVVRALVVVEERAAAWHEAGDLIRAREAGLIDESHVLAELRERDRVAALRDGDPDAVTLFKSVGHVALDVAAVEVALANLDSRRPVTA